MIVKLLFKNTNICWQRYPEDFCIHKYLWAAKAIKIPPQLNRVPLEK